MDSTPPKAAAPDATPPARRRATDDPVVVLKARILDKLNYQVGKSVEAASARDWFVATALAVRNVAVDSWGASRKRTTAARAKRVYYLSLEFLIGRLLMDAIGNLGLTETVREALSQCGVDLDVIAEEEPDAALGNGGLGRLAACFMESLSTLGISACGYGIRYEHGLFRQVIDHGLQQELPEEWLSLGNPWEFERIEIAYNIGFWRLCGGGAASIRCRGEVRLASGGDRARHGVRHAGDRGRAADQYAAALGGARATTPLHLENFNRGDHVGALKDRVRTEAISRVLYPGDESPAGQELRLRQEFFFASASLQDIIRRHMQVYQDLQTLPDQVSVQLNDTHPAISVAELMRQLVDEHAVPWDRAWEMTVAILSYTNHTLLPEALETWPVALMERLLPRQMQIIYMLNAQHLERARAAGADEAKLARVSLVDEQNGRRIRMGHLSFSRIARHQRRLRAAFEAGGGTAVFPIWRRCIPAVSATRPTASLSAAGCTAPIRG